MAPRQELPAKLETLVDHMFDQVFEADEREGLLAWIHEWEDANPDVDNAHRITGWIDVAYAFQARHRTTGEVRRPVRRPEPLFAWRSAVPTTA